MKLLFVCTGNIDRSPTAEDLMRNKPGIQARSAGTMPTARRLLIKEDIDWADRIFVMEEHHRAAVLSIAPDSDNRISVMGIPDLYQRGDPELRDIMKKRLRDEGIPV